AAVYPLRVVAGSMVRGAGLAARDSPQAPPLMRWPRTGQSCVEEDGLRHTGLRSSVLDQRVPPVCGPACAGRASPRRLSPALTPGQRGRRRRLDAGTIRVVRQLTELSSGRFASGPPKSDAGKRVIVLPAATMPIVRQHMSWLVKPDDEALVFTSPEGGPLRRHFRQRVWLPPLRAAG